MLLDLHIHTRRFSTCSVLDPRQLVHRALELGLNGICLTEHETLWTEGEIESLKRECEAQELVIIAGQEIRTYNGEGFLEGDILTFGFDGRITRDYAAGELIDLVHDQGGVAIAAHPYRGGLGLGDAVYNLDLDGIEVLNGSNDGTDERRARRACEQLNLAAVGGSDAHEVRRVGQYLTRFDNPIRGLADLVEAVRNRRCWPVPYEEALRSDRGRERS